MFLFQASSFYSRKFRCSTAVGRRRAIPLPALTAVPRLTARGSHKALHIRMSTRAVQVSKKRVMTVVGPCDVPQAARSHQERGN